MNWQKELIDQFCILLIAMVLSIIFLAVARQLNNEVLLMAFLGNLVMAILRLTTRYRRFRHLVQMMERDRATRARG